MSIGHHTRVATLGTLPPTVHVYPRVPQLELLRHADLFVTHGGMNSVNESIYAQVPMLVIPQGNDQPAIADRVQELGLGMRVDPEDANSERLRTASESILGSPSIKTQLSTISHDMHAAGGNTRAVVEITRMVETQRLRSRDT